MFRRMDRSLRLQTTGEEVFNAVTHGIGAGLSIVGLVLMLVRAANTGDPWRIVSAAIFGVSLFVLYVISTLYHAIAHPSAKRVLRVFDHITIFFLIAGTYTPFTLVSLHGWIGWTLFGVIWGLTILNTVLNAVSLQKFRIMSMISYVAMGWIIVLAFHRLWLAVGLDGSLLLLAGGVCYTVGIIFYGMKNFHFAHSIWHLFVLGGSILHFFSVYWYVL